MSEPRKDGGPAFPPQRYTDEIGMTLRDYFAAQALNGVVAIEYSKSWSGGPTISDEQIALRCYRVADLLLAEREK